MLAHHRRPVCLSFISTDLPILSTVETSATLYQKDQERFHLLLTQHEYPHSVEEEDGQEKPHPKHGLLWLELSPYRVVMTMQGNNHLNYRHFWEQGIYGVSRYWLHNQLSENNNCLRLRNYTRSLKLQGHPLPHSLRVEYELWSGKVSLGNYIVHLEIHH